jgi:predicted transcriptional regulator of viral defense system
MTSKRPATVLRDALSPGDPLSLDEAAQLVGGDRRAASRALEYLVDRGDFRMVRKRLVVKAGAAADPHRLAARITQPYAFGYGSAWGLHAGAASIHTELLVTSPHRFTGFEFEGVLHRWARPWRPDGLSRVSVGREFVWVTDVERTLVDCVRVPGNAGGVSELLRSLAGYPPVRAEAVVTWVDTCNVASVASRLGFLLERAGRPFEESRLLNELERRRSRSPVYLDPTRIGGHMIARWNVIVPDILTA